MRPRRAEYRYKKQPAATLSMVPPMINRKRGKTKEQRRREIGRMKKSDKKIAGKAKVSALIDRPAGKKKIKKKEQRARLLGAAAKAVAMEE